jgi:hypothetical protein
MSQGNPDENGNDINELKSPRDNSPQNEVVREAMSAGGGETENNSNGSANELNPFGELPSFIDPNHVLFFSIFYTSFFSH